MSAHDDLSSAMRDALSGRGVSLRAAALGAGLPVRSVQSVLDGRVPSINRAEEICHALGLEFYIGPPRPSEAGKNEPDFSASPVPPWLQEALNLPADADVDSVLEAVKALHESGEGAAVLALLCDKARAVDELRERLVQEDAAPEEVASVINAETQALHLEIARHLRPLAEVLDDAAALVGVLRPPGAGHGFGELQEMRHAEVQEVNSVAVDVVDVDAAAGGGSFSDQERVIGTLAFCRTWMENHYLTPRQCFVMGVRGESMEPILYPGSSILVDQDRRAWRPGKIFVVDAWHGLVVKYADEDEEGNWLLASAHESYEPIPFPEDAKIVGQVVWTARTVLDHSYLQKHSLDQ